MRRDLPLDDQAQPLGGFSLILEWCNVMVAGRNSSRRSGDRMAVVQLLPPVALHDYRYLGANFRERERIKHKRQRWTDRLHRLLMLETAGVARRDTCGLADLPSPEMTMPASEVTWKALTG